MKANKYRCIYGRSRAHMANTISYIRGIIRTLTELEVSYAKPPYACTIPARNDSLNASRRVRVPWIMQSYI